VQAKQSENAEHDEEEDTAGATPVVAAVPCEATAAAASTVVANTARTTVERDPISLINNV
jgi:hypothetical protein